MRIVATSQAQPEHAPNRFQDQIARDARIPYAIVLDDHPLIGWGIAQYLQLIRPELAVRVTTVWAQAQGWIKSSGCPNMLVADVSLADSSSFAAFTHWRSQSKCTPWLAICDDDEPQLMQQARSAGAQGLVYKRAPQELFSRAFSTILAGREWYEPWAVVGERRPFARAVPPSDLGLTIRQGDVLALVLRGLPNKRIAMMLEVSESTVKEHVTGILRGLGVRNRIHAITLLRGRRLTVECRQHEHAIGA